MMAATLAFAGLILLLLGGSALLALSQDRHRRAIGATPLRGLPGAAQRATGFALLAVALPLALWRDGPGFGTLVWAGLLMVTAFAVTFILSWRPAWLAPLARGRT